MNHLLQDFPGTKSSFSTRRLYNERSDKSDQQLVHTSAYSICSTQFMHQCPSERRNTHTVAAVEQTQTKLLCINVLVYVTPLLDTRALNPPA